MTIWDFFDRHWFIALCSVFALGSALTAPWQALKVRWRKQDMIRIPPGTSDEVAKEMIVAWRKSRRDE